MYTILKDCIGLSGMYHTHVYYVCTNRPAERHFKDKGPTGKTEQMLTPAWLFSENVLAPAWSFSENGLSHSLQHIDPCLIIFRKVLLSWPLPEYFMKISSQLVSL